METVNQNQAELFSLGEPLHEQKRKMLSGWLFWFLKLSAAKLTTEGSVPQLKRLSLCDNKKYVSL